MDKIIELLLAIIPFLKKKTDLEKIREAVKKQEIKNAEEKQALLAAIASGDIDAINALLFGDDL
jgi:hypothetical protein